jgi:hypothetical protein
MFFGISPRAILSWIAAIAVLPVFGEFFVELARQYGFYENPQGITGSVLNFISGLTVMSWYPWAAGFLIGIAVGAWINQLSSNKKFFSTSKAEQFFEMKYLIENVSNEWMDSFKDGFGSYDFDKPNYEADLRRKVLYAKLQKLGINTPDLSDLTRHMANVGHYTFMRCLVPFAEHGLLKEAKKEAQSTLEQIYTTIQQEE